MITFMGMNARLMDVPFPSYWKIESGKWCWYIFNDPNRMTPFGKINPETTKNAEATAMSSFKMMDVATVTSAVKADRTSVKLPKTAGAQEQVTILNQMPGPVTLQLSDTKFPELSVKLDQTNLNAGQKAILTIRTVGPGEFVSRIIRVLVQPTNQAIDIQVTY